MTLLPTLRSPRFCAPLVFLLMMIVGTYQLRLLGFLEDEAQAALFAMQILTSDHVSAPSICLFGKQLPVSELPPVGPMTTYSIVPFFLVLGTSVESARLSGIFYSALSLVVLFFLVCLYFNRQVTAGWPAVDQRIGHLRRYTKKMLLRRLERAGFLVEVCRYWNFLGLTGWLIYCKLMRRIVSGIRSSFGMRAYGNWLRVENSIRLPFGLTLVAKGRKNHTPVKVW